MKNAKIILTGCLISITLLGNVFSQIENGPNSISIKNLTREIPENGDLTALSNNNSVITITNCWISLMDRHINSHFPDYTPVLNEAGNKMFFTSRRSENTGNGKTIDGVFKPEDIYFSEKNDQGVWGRTKKISGKVNTTRNEAITWLSSDGKKMILYRNGDLFESELIENAWTKPTSIRAINSNYRETHASYSPDGNTIYFTTDDPTLAIVGGLDICMVKRDSLGDWGEPTLVRNVNSTLNEESPTLLADGKTFYFSSEGFSSMGGYDIFTSQLVNESFTEPENIGFPINTVRNEPFISIIDGGKKAFSSSDGGKKNEDQNIYEITFLNFVKVPLLVEVYDVDTKQLINSEIKLVDAKQKDDFIPIDNPTNGIFNASNLSLETHYTIYAGAKNYESTELTFSTANMPQFSPDTFCLVQKIYLKANSKEMVVNRILKNTIYFDYDKSELNLMALKVTEDILTVLEKNPTSKIIIHAHTDNTGDNMANYQLSDQRGNSVTNWFIQHGIDVSRILVNGYGEEEPIMENDTDSNKAESRRAEIEIIF